MIPAWTEPLRHDTLIPIWKALSFTGDATFFLIAFALGYWLWHRRVFAHATLLLLAVGLINSVLKAVFQVPRPEATYALVAAEGWSFPSGHSMVAAAVWPWLARELHDRTGNHRAMWVAIFFALGVGMSRIVLGVHNVRDVAWGLLLGALIFALARYCRSSPTVFWQRLGPRAQLVCLAVPVLTAVAWTPIYDHDTIVAVSGGALLTVWLGWRFSERRGLALPLGAFAVLAGLVGLAGTFGLRVGLAQLFESWLPAPKAADFVRYAVIGLWISAVAPRLFAWMTPVQRPERKAMP